MNTVKYSVNLMMNTMTKDEPAKAYARLQYNDVVSTKKFVNHISEHNGVFSKGTVKGVITDLVSCLREMLVSGNKVVLEGLGSFSPTLSSKGADSVVAFTAANITGMNIVFTPAEELQNLLDDATFEQVTTRRVQAAALKAEKTGQDTVNISKNGGASDEGV